MARRSHALPLLLWLLVAALLRGWALQRWSLWGDEAHTLSDVMDLDRGELRDSIRSYPLFYLLEWCAMKGLSGWVGPETYLRLIPAISGTLAVGAFFHGMRETLSLQQRHLGALLLCASPWLLYHSQFARFYSMLLLLSVLFCAAFLRAIRSGSRRSMIAAMAWCILALAVHPSAGLLFAGLLLASMARRAFLGTPRLRLLRLPIGLSLAGGVVSAVFLRGPLSRTVGFKLSAADQASGGISDFVQGVIYNFGLAPSLLAGVGLIVLLRRSRGLALDVGVGAGVPFAVLGLLATRGVMIEQRYLIPCLPLLLIPVCVAAEELIRGLQGRILMPARVVVLLLLLPFVPALASNYLDGDRHDLRSVARFLADRVQPDDLVVCECHSLMEYYLSEFPSARILEAPPQFEDQADGMSLYWMATSEMRRDEKGFVWACVPEHFDRQPGNRQDFLRWLRSEGRLMQAVGRTRLDYHQNRLELYRVDVGDSRPWRPTLEQ